MFKNVPFVKTRDTHLTAKENMFAKVHGKQKSELQLRKKGLWITWSSNQRKCDNEGKESNKKVKKG